MSISLKINSKMFAVCKEVYGWEGGLRVKKSEIYFYFTFKIRIKKKKWVEAETTYKHAIR